MDRQTNRRLNQLDRRLQRVYSEALQSALRREQEALRRLQNFAPDPNLSAAANEARARQFLMRLEQQTGFVNNISSDLARSGELATQMIRGDALNVFNGAYHGNVTAIARQLGGTQFQGSFSVFDRNTINAIFNGEQSRIGQLRGFQGSFEQVGNRLIFDRQRGNYFFDVARGRISDDRAIVTKLQNALASSMMQGDSVRQVATRIRAITESSRQQAVTIARTEMLKAYNQGKMLGHYQAEDMGIPLRKKWVATHDDRTRDDHIEMDGVTVETDEPFIVGGVRMMYPHDPNGGAGNVVNCRCTFISEVVRSRMVA